LRRGLRGLPFPRQKGFSLAQSLYLSLAVLGRRASEDKSLDLALYAATPLEWIFPAKDFLAACLPRDLLELPLPPIPDSRGRLRGMTAAAGQDEGYRLSLAAWREGGGRLFSVQHGANYGNLRSLGGSFFEYRQQAFCTWGWKRHQDYPCNAVPLPHPLVAGLYGRHAERRAELILVGTEMSPFLYRLKSRPQAGQLPQYRRDKVRFFQSLPGEILERSLYRPYFAAASGLEDGAYVSGALPGLALCRGDLNGRMLGCRLLILDHYGTTLPLALAANVPSICFWNRRDWGMNEDTEKVLDALCAAGILQPGPEAAAAKAAAVWPETAAWWASGAVQAARRLWLEKYAWSPARNIALLKLWRKALGGL
jgi:putative transferase (TIGR04331 family)